MRTSTVNIAFPTSLLQEIDMVAKKESRNRSELLRTAIRLYIDRKKRWESLFQAAGKSFLREKMTGKDIEREITAYRCGKGRSLASRS